METFPHSTPTKPRLLRSPPFPASIPSVLSSSIAPLRSPSTSQAKPLRRGQQHQQQQPDLSQSQEKQLQAIGRETPPPWVKVSVGLELTLERDPKVLFRGVVGSI
ncbi:hypothetical protein PTKIN_Ptkin06aG0144100 [Pterospermum kingtungense]